MSTDQTVMEQALREAIVNGPKLSSDMTNEEAVDVAMSIVKGERTLRDIKGLTDDEMEAAYSQGYSYFQSGAYAKAEDVFSFLVTFDPFQDKYWKALGACRYNVKDYVGAINAYIQAAAIDVSDPELVIKVAQCRLGMGEKDVAIGALEAAVELAEMEPEKHAAKKQKAEALLELLQGEN